MITYLIGFLYVVEVVACLLLGLVVMLQKPKEGGLGGLAGGMGEAVFGADAGNVLIKVTIWLGAIFLANTLVLARLTSKANSKSLMAGEKAPVPVQQMPALPPAAPAPAPAAAPAAKPAPAPAPAAAPAAKPAPAPAPAAKPAPAPAPAAAPAAKPAPAKPAPAPAPAAAPAKPAPAPAPAAPAKK